MMSNLKCDFWVCRKNQKSHVTTNLVHKLFRIQSIAPQPLPYFEGLVSPTILEAARNKQAGKNRTWFTLTVEGLNGVLYHVMSSSSLIMSSKFWIFNSCITLYSLFGDFLLILRLFTDVAFTFVGTKTLQICYVPNFGYIYETQKHGITHSEMRK